MLAAVGKFISIEGGEGVGKSSFTAALLAQLQQSLGSGVVATREPGGTPVADRLRQIFVRPPDEDPLSPMTELLLVSAARAQHIFAKIKPALRRGDFVVCDRFYDSTRVYQGILGALDRSQVELIIAASVGDTNPAVTLLLDCDVDVSLQRLQRRQLSPGNNPGDVSRFDSAGREYHERLRQAYLQLAREYSARMVVLDATPPTEVVVQQALSILRQRGLIG